MRISTGLAFATIFVATLSTVSAQPLKVEVGVLECGGTTTSFVVGSVTELRCVFKSSAGGSEPYSATIRRVGLDIGINEKTVVAWAVFAPTRQAGPNDLRGNYGGVAASATVGVGLGANVLIGGSGNTIALQQVSVQGQTGIGIAAGIAGLELRPAGR